MKKTIKVVLAFLCVIVCAFLSFMVLPKEVSLVFFSNYSKEENAYIEEKHAYINEKHNLVMENGNKTEEYDYSGFPTEYQIGTDKSNVKCFITKDNNIIISYQFKGLTRNYLKNHIEDQFIIMNDEKKTANVVYTSPQKERIIYGNSDNIIVFDSNDNLLKTKSINDGRIIKSIPIDNNRLFSEYEFDIYLDNNSIEIYEDNYLIHNHFIASYEIDKIIN